MEKNMKDKDSMYCACDNCRPGMSAWHSHHRFYLLRWLLGLIILMIVFGLGVKIGEFKGMFDQYEYSNRQPQLYKMMYAPYAPATTAAPSTTTKTTTK